MRIIIIFFLSLSAYHPPFLNHSPQKYLRSQFNPIMMSQENFLACLESFQIYFLFIISFFLFLFLFISVFYFSYLLIYFLICTCCLISFFLLTSTVIHINWNHFHSKFMILFMKIYMTYFLSCSHFLYSDSILTF